MTKTLPFILLLLSNFVFRQLPAQILDPVRWSFTSQKINDCEFELVIKADIDPTWHLYSQKHFSDDGPPVTTVFAYFPNANYELVGKTLEGKLIKKFEPLFGVELEFFEHEAIFRQRIKTTSEKSFELKGELEFVTCNNNTCIPPAIVPFAVKIEGCTNSSRASVTSLTATTTSKNNTPDKTISGLPNERLHTGTGSIQAVVSDSTNRYKDTLQQTISTGLNKTTETTGRSWWGIFVLGFIGGLAALLTPCVFPMIPMTVSFFTKRSKTRAGGISNALTYSIAIIVIYVALGLSVTTFFGSSALNELSTSVWFNLAFFILLVVFALSFLGAFEIVLPSRFVNKIDSRSDKGGLLGIFFMAFTLSLVSFSCTGPIIGTLLVDAAVNGGIKGPFWGMLGFSTALALPFGLFAAFPGWLNSLPKSGGWLNSVKVVLGFLELALALKFASTADLVMQTNIITREVFISVWVIIFGLLGIYLLGGIKFSHDSETKHVSVPRFLLAVLTLSFTVYLIPGLWGAPLKMISGFPPPDFYSEAPGFFTTEKNTPGTNETDHKKEHCPNDLPCFHDYEEARAYAKKVGKPLMIDFTGWGCINCRKMEAKVWTDPEVDKRLRNEVVVVSLYVDDKNKLPLDQQTIKKLGNKDYIIRNIGNKWSYMQASRYNTNAQPQYILIDENEQMLTKETAFYDPDITHYINWLDEGITRYKQQTKHE